MVRCIRTRVLRVAAEGVLNESHRGDLGAEAHDVPPGIAKHMRQVEQEVDEAPTGGCQIRPREKHTDEKHCMTVPRRRPGGRQRSQMGRCIAEPFHTERKRQRSGEKNDRANIVIVKELLRQMMDLSTEREDIQP